MLGHLSPSSNIHSPSFSWLLWESQKADLCGLHHPCPLISGWVWLLEPASMSIYLFPHTALPSGLTLHSRHGGSGFFFPSTSLLQASFTLFPSLPAPTHGLTPSGLGLGTTSCCGGSLQASPSLFLFF